MHQYLTAVYINVDVNTEHSILMIMYSHFYAHFFTIIILILHSHICILQYYNIFCQLEIHCILMLC